jgi:hypothetical protein
MPEQPASVGHGHVVARKNGFGVGVKRSAVRAGRWLRRRLRGAGFAVGEHEGRMSEKSRPACRPKYQVLLPSRRSRDNRSRSRDSQQQAVAVVIEAVVADFRTANGRANFSFRHRGRLSGQRQVLQNRRRDFLEGAVGLSNLEGNRGRGVRRFGAEPGLAAGVGFLTRKNPHRRCRRWL